MSVVRRVLLTEPFVLVALISVLLFVPFTAAKLLLGKGKALFVNDGFYYYSYTVSLALDRDLDFSNQYRFNKGWANRGHMALVPKTGRPRNLFAIGAGLIWMPAFLVTHLIVLALKALGEPLTTTGFEIYYQLPTYFWSFAVGLLGMALLHKLLYSISGDKSLSGWTIATAIFGTTISVYAFFHCNFAHWVSAAMVAINLFMALHLAQHPERLSYWFLAGLTLGEQVLLDGKVLL